MHTTRRTHAYLLALGVFGLAGCHLNDVLRVPTPAGVSSGAQLSNQAGAEGVYLDARANLYTALDQSYGGLIATTGLMTDEFTWAQMISNPGGANMDARRTTPSAALYYNEQGDRPWTQVLSARSALLVAIPGLAKYEDSVGQSKVGEAYALVGYAELMVAESYCDGTPLSQVIPNGGVVYGHPLTDDSILGVAQAHFDSAVGHAAGNDTTLYLASVGLGRVLLDRGQYAAAATAVANVSPAFVFNGEMEPGSYYTSPGYATNSYNFYDNAFYNGNIDFNVSNQEGGNGLNFVAAHDPRLAFDSSQLTLDGGPWYLPLKFKANLSYIPLSTGIEAALISAEAALQRQDYGTWLNDLNALRNSGFTVQGTDTTYTLGSGQVAGQTSGLASLADPGSDSARVSLMFRERAFWLFGTGSRLGDLRRLIRQYNRPAESVFPTGAYPAPFGSYGTDVEMTLPSQAAIAGGAVQETNPYYKGCTSPTTTA